jgi:GNAT superfamily N-acetyltransferase
MGINLETLIILAVLAFILFGPEKLPEYAATLGRFVAKMRQNTAEMTRQYQNPFQYPPEPTPPPLPESSCPYCHQPVTLNFAFCPKCGHRLQQDHYPPPPPPPEPVSQAALAYKGVIPADCWQEPYMPEEELRAEMAAGVNFWSYETEAGLVGVMGRQDLQGVTLIRHAYVDPAAQRQGVGARLLAHLQKEIPAPILVGTWAAAWWAIRFYEKHGFRLVTQAEKDRLLNTYWTITPRQVETSVVLADPKWFGRAGYAG